MAGRQISAAVSDFFLALSAYFAAVCLYSSHPISAIGISLQGFAALIGIFRYAADSPDSLIVDVHAVVCSMATLSALPGFATGFCNYFNLPYMGYLIVLLSCITFIFGCFMDKEVRQNIAEMVAGFSLLCIILFCLYYGHKIGLTACAVYILAAGVGTEGSIAGIPKIDILHYGLVLGNMAFIEALK